MPDGGEAGAVRFGEALDGQLLDHLVERHPVELVEVEPRQLAAGHPGHGGAVAAAPRVRHSRPIGLHAAARAQRLALLDHRGTPVDDGAEDVERERLRRHHAGEESGSMAGRR